MNLKKRKKEILKEQIPLSDLARLSSPVSANQDSITRHKRFQQKLVNLDLKVFIFIERV
jgi:hypothetical protein